jgi:hypothetical protein
MELGRLFDAAHLPLHHFIFNNIKRFPGHSLKGE